MHQNATIWLVDDDIQLIEIIERAFKMERLTCQIVSFTNDAALQEALDRSTTLPNLLIVDYFLPDTDGLQLIKRLKDNPTTSSMKMILFSQTMKLDIATKAQELDVYQIIQKPSDFRGWRDLADELCLAGYFSGQPCRGEDQ
ncbi:hypothetical protein GCM10027592_41580 [Spirosoma flavus]